MEELVSIIIPVYNTEPYIRSCIRSVTRQTYETIEIIVVNDGTTDQAMSIVKEYAETDRRIRIINQENGGLSAARNTGLDQARGEYIFFLDSDDAIHHRTIEILYMLLTHQKVDIVACDFLKCSLIPEDFPVNNIKFEVVDQQKAYENLFCKKTNGARARIICAKLFKKSLFNKVKFPLGKYHEDEYVIHEILENVNSVCYCFISFYYYYKNMDSIMHHLTLKRAFDAIEACKNRLNFFIKQKNDFLITKSIHQYLNTTIDNYFGLRKAGLLTKKINKIIICDFREVLNLRYNKYRFDYVCFGISPRFYYYFFRMPKQTLLIFLRLLNKGYSKINGACKNKCNNTSL